MYQIALPDTGQALPLGDRPLSVGRGPTNDVVLADDAISWHHAQLWMEAGTAWVRDVGSRNGTFVNGERCVGSTRLAVGDTVRLGPLLELVVEGAGGPAVDGQHGVRHLEDMGAGVRLRIASDRFRIGAGTDCDLRVEDAGERRATVLLHDNGEIWLGTAEGDRPLDVGEVFTFAGRRLRVVEEPVDHAPTLDIGAVRYPYVLRLSTGPDGPQAVLSDPVGGATLLVTGNRGILLFLLGQALQKHRAEGALPAEEGWVDTASVITGVWGRGGATTNHLNVLVHRTRQQLEKKGFDPWCIEKRRGGVRLRVRTLEDA